MNFERTMGIVTFFLIICFINNKRFFQLIKDFWVTILVKVNLSLILLIIEAENGIKDGIFEKK